MMCWKHLLLIITSASAAHAHVAQGSWKHFHDHARTVEVSGGSLAVEASPPTSVHGQTFFRRSSNGLGTKTALPEHSPFPVESRDESLFTGSGQANARVRSEHKLIQTAAAPRFDWFVRVKALHPTYVRVASITVLVLSLLVVSWYSTMQLIKTKRSRAGKTVPPLPSGSMPVKGKGKGKVDSAGKGLKGNTFREPLPDDNAVHWGNVPKEEGGTYPWDSMPSREALLAVGPCFHSNLNSVLPQCLTNRGLRKAGKGEVALVAMWNWPGERQRALFEMCLQDTLSNKRALAEHLKKKGLAGMAPPTFSGPADLRKALGQVNTKTGIPRLPKEARQGLWFLKHASNDSNTGVACYKGVEALLARWEDPEFGDDPNDYLAQAEVHRPLLFHGISGSMHKATVRAYVLVLGNGRCFLHRELLLKSHPRPYDSADPDPMKHVLCHVKYDGVVSSLGSNWDAYNEVWPRIGQMVIANFRHYDALSALRDEDLDSEKELSWAFVWATAGIRLRRLFREYGLSPFIQRRRGTEEAQTMKYAFLGVDVIVDEDLRPWLLELTRSPSLAVEPRDPLGSRIKADVIEDFCELLVDPLLQAAAAAAKNFKPRLPVKEKGAPLPTSMPAPRFVSTPAGADGSSLPVGEPLQDYACADHLQLSQAGGADMMTAKEKEEEAVGTMPKQGVVRVSKDRLAWQGLHTWVDRMAAGEVGNHSDLPKAAPDVKGGLRGFVELRERVPINHEKAK